MTAHDDGLAAEEEAAQFLIQRGYVILVRRFRNPAQEIDIIARSLHGRDTTLVFVEVKARDTEVLAIEALGQGDPKRYAGAADIFLSLHPEYTRDALRFDGILICPGQDPLHMENIW